MYKRQVLDLYNEIAASRELTLDMSFEPGDIQLLSNHTILHARRGYEDFPDPDQKRHLLRLWLSLPAEQPITTRLLAQRARLTVIATAARYKMKHAWRRSVAGRRAP